MNSDKPIALLVNPAAGSGNLRMVRKQFLDYLQTASIDFKVFEAYWPASLDGYRQVIIMGGDGTLNFFINKYKDCKVPIGLIASGSGNDFAWKIYGKISDEQQFHKAIFGDVHEVDAGVCNGQYFINGAGIGFDGAVVNNMKRKRLRPGWLAYYAAVLRTIFLYRSQLLDVNIKTPAQHHYSKKIFMLTIANGERYGGNFVVAPRASINDGLLEMVQIGAVNVLKRYFYLPRMKKGRHIGLPFVDYFQVKSITVTADKPIAAHLDGELLITTHFEISILPAQFLFRY